jgi:hypothetical protein
MQVSQVARTLLKVKNLLFLDSKTPIGRVSVTFSSLPSSIVESQEPSQVNEMASSNAVAKQIFILISYLCTILIKAMCGFLSFIAGSS